MKTIPLTQGKFAIVDDEDFEYLSKWKWHIGGRGYAVRRENGKDVFMHRLLLQISDRFVTDHRNGIRTDNRKDNLRSCTKHQNLFNQGKQLRHTASKFKGITFENRKWRARIALNGKRVHLGTYLTEREAAKAYDDAANRLYGDFARLNIAA